MKGLQKIIEEQVRQLVGDSLKEDFSGWVNVKIDKELVTRVDRLMRGLGFGEGNIETKMQFLSNPLDHLQGDGMTRAISAVIILQFLKEIKDQFHPSSSGFLFESFMAGLIGGKVIEGNQSADIEQGGQKYQLKLYAYGSGVLKESKGGGELPDYYIAGFKRNEDVEVYMMDYDDFLESTTRTDPSGKSYMTTRDFIQNGTPLGKLELSRIDELSSQINEDVMGTVSELWEQISKLHYNVETMVTGISAENTQMSSEEAANEALGNTRIIDDIISNIYTSFT